MPGRIRRKPEMTLWRGAVFFLLFSFLATREAAAGRFWFTAAPIMHATADMPGKAWILIEGLNVCLLLRSW